MTKFSTTFEQIVFAHWLQGWDQSYFMALFFFISAYFTPTSLDRKCRDAFLADKVQRLGIVFVAWITLLGWLQLTCARKVTNSGMPGYELRSGPPWFIGWLLGMNIMYSFSAGEPHVVAPPSLTVFFVTSFVLGYVCYSMSLVDGGSSGFFTMPLAPY